MDKQTYLQRFSRAARWRLGSAEAADVVADYADLLDQRTPEQADTLVEDLGKPEAAARLLTEEKPYRRWLGIFGVLMFCLLLPELLLLGVQYAYNRYLLMDYGPFAVGLALALIWFRPRLYGKKTPLPRGLLWALAGVLVFGLAAGAILASLFTGAWERWNWPLESYGPTAQLILCVSGTVAAAAGIHGAVRARMDDRRWGALYVLGLTTVVICMQILATLSSLDGADLDWRGWLMRYSLRWAALGGIGLVGTGVILC